MLGKLAQSNGIFKYGLYLTHIPLFSQNIKFYKSGSGFTILSPLQFTLTELFVSLVIYDFYFSMRFMFCYEIYNFYFTVIVCFCSISI